MGRASDRGGAVSPQRHRVRDACSTIAARSTALGDAVAAAPYKGAPKASFLAVKPRQALVAPGGDRADQRRRRGARGRCRARLVIGTTHALSPKPTRSATSPASSSPATARCHARATSARRSAPWRATRRASSAPPVAARRGRRSRRVGDPRLRRRRARAVVEHGRACPPVARLIADISDFMTLMPGDVLLTGSAPDGPRARAGAQIAIEIDGIGRLETRVVAGAARLRA